MLLKSVRLSKIYESALALLILRILGVAVAFLSTVVLARLLGAEGLGVFTYAVVVITFLGLICNAGMPVLLTRQLSAAFSKREHAVMKGLLNWSVICVIVMTSIAFIVVFVYLRIIRNDYSTNDVSQAVQVSIMILPCAALIHRGRGALLGLGHPVLSALPEQLLRPIIALALYLVAARYFEFDALKAIAMLSIAYFFAAMFVTWQVEKSLPENVKVSLPIYKKREWTTALLPLTGLAGVSIIKHQTDIIMLAQLADYSDVGVYRVASQIATIPTMLMIALNSVYSPKIAATNLVGNKKFQRQLIQSAQLMFLFAVTFLVFFWFFGEFAIVHFFGQEFQSAFWFCLVLIFGAVFSAWCGQTATILKMTNNAGVALRASVEAAVLNVFLNIALISYIGAIGAAYATSISLIWVQSRQLLFVNKIIGIIPHAFAMWRLK